MREPFSINLGMEIQISNRSCLSEFNKRTSNGPVVVIITSETVFRQDVGELILGIEVFDMDFCVRFFLKTSPAQRGSRHMSHRRTSAFVDHFDFFFIVLEQDTAQQRDEKVLPLIL